MMYWAKRRARLALGVLNLRTFSQFISETAPPPGSDSFLQTNKPKAVLMFACTPAWIETCFAMAAALIGRGHSVTFAYLPYYMSHRSFAYGDHLSTGAAFDALIRFKLSACRHPRLRIVDLRTIPTMSLSRDMADAVHRKSFEDLKYALKLDSIDTEGDLDQRNVLEFRLRRNTVCAKAIAQLLAENHFDAAIVPNGINLEFGAAYTICQNRGIPTSTCDFAGRIGRIMVSHGRPIGELDLGWLWKKEAPYVLSPDQRVRLENLMAVRSGTQWNGFEVSLQRSAKSENARSGYAKLGLRPDGPTALMCTNIAWDPPMLDWYRLFDTQRNWLSSVLDFFDSNPKYQLIIRAHPWEATAGTASSVSDYVATRFPKLPPNIVLIGPDNPTNTYDLMDLASVGLVHSGTCGLEMAIRGIPVLTIAPTHYYYLGKGFTLDPGSETEYFQVLHEILDGPDRYRLTRPVIDMAWCFADFYFHRLPQPFPWINATRHSDFSVWPIRRVLSPEGCARFDRTFELLIGNQTL